MTNAIIAENETWKILASKDVNYRFNKVNGYFEVWGRTKEENITVSNVGPFILDLEISTICSGPTVKGKHKLCQECYKNNIPNGKKMSFDVFKTIFDKMPRSLTSIAYGIGDLPLDNEDDMWKMFKYSRDNGVIPNVTINGARTNDTNIGLLSNLCGAVAVSAYSDIDLCAETIYKLGVASEAEGATLKQINIHKILSHQTYQSCFDLVDLATTDERLKKYLNAIVFLTLKPKGNRNRSDYITDIGAYKKLVKYAMERGVRFGFDSCSASMFLRSMQDEPNFKMYAEMSSACESTLESAYINVDGDFFPCSFTENEEGWETGLSVPNSVDFMKDIWYHEKTVDFRNRNLASTDKSVCDDCRACVTFPEIDPRNWDSTKKVILIKEI